MSNQHDFAHTEDSRNQEIQTTFKKFSDTLSIASPLRRESVYPIRKIKAANAFTEIIGESKSLQEAFRLVSIVSSTNSTVLILGETGTGKELIANAIHANSPRRNKAMVRVNCAVLPVNFIESELFGHERGSFTGATERRLGKFELANGGTLFLDEIGEMTVDLQAKLLRALQEKEIERLGGKGPIKIDVRIIAATNRNLEKEMMEGRFRSDLFYRLNVFPISLPPLRDRKQDIEQLTMHFINHYNPKCDRSIEAVTAQVFDQLKSYHWPGNVRELEHLIERSVLLAKGNILDQVNLPSLTSQPTATTTDEKQILKTIDQNEKEHIYSVLEYCNGKISGRGGAAEVLGVPPSTLNSKIRRLGIKRVHTI